ncbi:MAG: nicotinate-nucleotide adenylyltransferase [Tannerella sp.]|jgi:nicotinate-nucleotide adenylyltransferase|nr:nicotinate-nucleotide adenylyltransferase [Tannerella sp.]
MKKIGIFSGSFNPIHIGHLALANWLCEYVALDEVWFLVTPLNPLKDKDELMDYDARFEMVKAAIAGYPKFKASDIECSLPLPSYTIDTLQALHQIHPNFLFHLIIGADSWASIHLWKDAEQLMHDFPILIYPRKNYEETETPPYPHIQKVDAPLIEVSSSFIRKALDEGKDIRFFLPETSRQLINIFAGE